MTKTPIELKCGCRKLFDDGSKRWFLAVQPDCWKHSTMIEHSVVPPGVVKHDWQKSNFRLGRR